MFLFTTPPSARDPAAAAASTTAAAAPPVVEAIRQGAERTGVGFDYLLATAQRESALNPQARAPTSSAAGLFQFVEQTWLGLVKSEGPKLGLDDYAGAIATRPDGTHAVPDRATKQAILGLREDPKVASVMAGALTQQNRDRLAQDLGREPSPGDLYAAHFLGARGASDLIRAARANPTRPAAADFPDAAAANRSIFYDRQNRARGAGEVYALLAGGHGAGAGASAAPAFGPDRPLTAARADGPALYGLFRTEGRQGPVSEAVAKLWRRSDAAAPRVQTAALAGGFFPRSDAGSAVEVAAAGPDPVTTGSQDDAPPALVPLPPARPAGLGVAAAAPPRPGPKARAPLDLGAFMTGGRA